MHPNHIEHLPICKASKARGVILPMVLVFLCILGILVFTFTNWATQSKRTSWLEEQEEIGKRVIESAVDEAFFTVSAGVQDPDSEYSKWLIDKTKTESKVFRLDQLPRTKALAEELKAVNPTRIADLTVTAAKRMEDFRDFRSKDGMKIPYYGNEGHGSLALTGIITLSHGSRNLRSNTLERHHDYKVLNLVSSRSAPSRSKAENRNLDYVLYVRNGYQEFQDTAGRMLNNNTVGLEFRPDGRGKIYFGGTENADSFIFLNLCEEVADKIPADDGVKTLDSGEKDQLVDNVLAEPEAKQKIEAEIQSQASAAGSPVTPDTEQTVKDEASKENVTIKSSNIPFTKAPADKEKDARDKLLGDPNASKDPRDNGEVGIKLIPASEVPHQVIEGHIRQRFLKIVEVEPKGIIQTLLSMLPEKLNFLLSYSPADYEEGCKRKGKSPSRILMGIYKFLDKLRPDALKSAVTKVDDELPYGSKLESERKPSQAKPPSLSEDYDPFSYTNLRSYSAADMADLETLGFLSGNQLKLCGAVHVRGPIVLGANGPITVSGRGILSTSSDITIKAGITCSSGNSLLILNTLGNIIVSTSDTIEAGIVGNEVTVQNGCGFHLKGSLFVNRLGSANWPAGPHVLEYDSSRFYQEQDVSVAALSPRVTFIRLTASE